MRRGILVVVFLAPLVAGCALNPPRIVSISPNREVTDVATNAAITISFDRPMNHASVERRFQVSPPVPGCDATGACRYAWTGNTFMFLHPSHNFDLHTEYTVSMHAGYADASGQQNSLEHVWHFTTEVAPALNSADPADNAVGVAPDRNIVLTFSRPMQADSVQAALQVTPVTSFLLRSRPGGDGTQFEMVPLNLLQPNQSYTISIGRPLDVHGNPIAAPVQSRFKTGPLTLARKIGYLVGQPGQPPFAVGVVVPHPHRFRGRSTPKIIYSLSPQSQVTDQLLGFDWSPDSQRIAVIEAARGASSGPIQMIDLASGTIVRPGISGDAVYWSVDGTIMYLSGGVLRRFNPITLQDGALTDLSDGRVIAPVAVSPDGRSVAYTTVEADGLDHLWIMNLDLRTRYRPIGLSDPADRPAWSPNGTKLAFRRLTSAGAQLSVYDLSASGTGAYRSGGPLDVTGVAWLNDNSTLFAATGDGGGGSLYRVNIFSAAEAGGVVKVTGGTDAPNGSAPNAPAYDRRVAFTGVVDGVPQVFVMNGDGSRPQQLTLWETDDPLTGSNPNWTPAG